MFIVACADELPDVLRVVNEHGAGGAVRGHVSRVGRKKDAPLDAPMVVEDVFGVITPSRGLLNIGIVSGIPPLPIMSQPDEWEQAGLTAELADRFKSAERAVMIQMQDPAVSVVDTVTFATELADRVTVVARGCADDFNAQRFFAEGSWRVDPDNEDFIPAEHISLHVLPAPPKGLWVHTHGLVKFGRPELEMRGVPPELLKEAMNTTLNFASYVVEERPIAPGHTVGNPQTPLHARLGRADSEHWEGAPVLELVDVDKSGQPVPIGVERGLRSMIWAQ
jgi:hypothetical protein